MKKIMVVIVIMAAVILLLNKGDNKIAVRLFDSETIVEVPESKTWISVSPGDTVVYCEIFFSHQGKKTVREKNIESPESHRLWWDWGIDLSPRLIVLQEGDTIKYKYNLGIVINVIK